MCKEGVQNDSQSPNMGMYVGCGNSWKLPVEYPFARFVCLHPCLASLCPGQLILLTWNRNIIAEGCLTGNFNERPPLSRLHVSPNIHSHIRRLRGETRSMYATARYIIYQPKELVTLQRNQRLQVVGSGSPDKSYCNFQI